MNPHLRIDEAKRKNGSRKGPARPTGRLQRASLPARLARTLQRMPERKENYADSFLRPRRRRLRRTLRPPVVALRAKKPWRRARTRLLGWNVRFMVEYLEYRIKRAANRRAASQLWRAY